MSQQTESQDWQIEGQQLRYVNAALQAGGIQPGIQYAGNGVYVVTIVVPVGFDLPSYLERAPRRRRPFWQRIDFCRWLPVLLIVAVIAAVGYLLAYGAPAAIADVMPQIQVPAILAPVVNIDVPNPLAGVQRQIDGMLTGAMMIVQLAAGLVVLWLLWIFRGPLSAVGGGIWKAGSNVASMVGKRGKDA